MPIVELSDVTFRVRGHADALRPRGRRRRLRRRDRSGGAGKTTLLNLIAASTGRRAAGFGWTAGTSPRRGPRTVGHHAVPGPQPVPSPETPSDNVGLGLHPGLRTEPGPAGAREPRPWRRSALPARRNACPANSRGESGSGSHWPVRRSRSTDPPAGRAVRRAGSGAPAGDDRGGRSAAPRPGTDGDHGQSSDRGGAGRGDASPVRRRWPNRRRRSPPRDDRGTADAGGGAVRGVIGAIRPRRRSPSRTADAAEVTGQGQRQHDHRHDQDPQSVQRPFPTGS